MTERSFRRAPALLRVLSVWLCLASCVTVRAQPDDEPPVEPLFNWDLIALEQNNSRFNGSVLTGFHSLRSPGVTPLGRVKLGLGWTYTREEQLVDVAGGVRSLSRRQQTFLTPKLAAGIFDDIEAGIALATTHVTGRQLVSRGGGGFELRDEEELRPYSVDLGVKWRFLDRPRWRLAASFDSRIALARGRFGMLAGSFYNFEIDGDFALTQRWSLVGNLQFLTSDHDTVRDQFIGDLASEYSFSDTFRGMLFTTLQEDDTAGGAVLGFFGVAGEYVWEQHSLVLSIDFQLNEARRDVRTEDQLDIALSYTFSF